MRRYADSDNPDRGIGDIGCILDLCLYRDGKGETEMSRYVDYDAIDYRNDKMHDKSSDFIDGVIYMAQRIEEAPSIDIVRRKAVKGYGGYYEVDMYGNVYSVERTVRVNDNGREYDKPVKERKMKQSNHSKGYKIVPLTKDGVTKSHYVHRIVAEAYIDNPYNLPFINHKDEDKTNNFVGNLEWCTEQYNSTYGNARKKHADALRGRPLSEEHKEKIRQGNIGKHGKPYGEREGK